MELAFWETVRESGADPEMIKAYMDKYPDGEFKALAEILLPKQDGEDERPVDESAPPHLKRPG